MDYINQKFLCFEKVIFNQIVVAVLEWDCEWEGLSQIKHLHYHTVTIYAG